MPIDRYKQGPNWKWKGHTDEPVGQNPTQPNAPTSLSGNSITTTGVTLTWVKSSSTNVTEQRIYSNGSLFQTIANNTQQSLVVTGLTSDTPYSWQIIAFDDASGLASPASNTYSMRTSAVVVVNAPNVVGSFTATKSTTSPTSAINVSWSAPAVDGTHSAATGYRVYANGVKKGSDIAAPTTTSTITGLNDNTSYTITVKAFNSAGEGPATTGITVKTDAAVVSNTVMLMGCSDSPNDHGGTEVWDGWRVYTKGARDTRANRTGSQRPQFLAYSEDGPNLGGASPNYNTVYQHVIDDLEAFYYSSGDTHSARWGIKLFWSNGNENSDKGALSGTTHTSAQITAYTTSQKALYDACHYAPGGVRRYPDAYAGSNPTQNQEQQGFVADWLHPSARYHDFVMWSMYPPGRSSTPSDPTFTKPSLIETDRTNLQKGFLIRCFYRTFQAQAAARSATGNNNFKLLIGCGEVGIGDDPQDRDHRPYYATHSLAGTMETLSDQYNIEMSFACWWDNQTDASSPQNILSDEPTATSPSTRVAWQTWKSLNHEYGGTHPSNWPAGPKSTWPTGA